MALIGGVFICIVLGTMFNSWGAFSLYVISFFRQYNSSLSPEIASIISPILQTFAGVSSLIGLIVAKSLGIQQTNWIAGFVIVIG